MMATRAPLRVLLAPLPAIGLGAYVAHRHGVGPMAFAPNLLAFVVGILLVRLAPLRARLGPSPAGMLAALGVLVATLAFAGTEGVRRWIPLGPVAIHASQVVAPYLLAIVATTRRRALLVTGLVALVHGLQPDAGQATAFGLAAATVCVISDAALGARIVVALVALGGVAAAWARSDGLAPVDHVERIVHLAFASGALCGVAALVALALLVAPLADAALRTGDRARVGAACLVYFVASIAVTELGSFPVPVLGGGASGVLGWFALVRAVFDAKVERR